MTSTAILIDNQIVRTPEKIKFKVPQTASEAYDLGITMEELFLNIYRALAERCQSQTGHEVFELFAAQQKRDLETFTDCFNFELNCEISHFYLSNGKIMQNDVRDEEIAKTYLLISRNLENFFQWIQEVEAKLSSKKSSKFGEYLPTIDSKEIYPACMKTRYNTIELYRRLAKLYPPGNMRIAFEEMADILEKGNKNLII